MIIYDYYQYIYIYLSMNIDIYIYIYIYAVNIESYLYTYTHGIWSKDQHYVGRETITSQIEYHMSKIWDYYRRLILVILFHLVLKEEHDDSPVDVLPLEVTRAFCVSGLAIDFGIGIVTVIAQA